MVKFKYWRIPPIIISLPLKNLRQSQVVDPSRDGAVVVPDIDEFFRLGNNMVVLQPLKGEKVGLVFRDNEFGTAIA